MNIRALVFVSLFFCCGDNVQATLDASAMARPEGWGEQTHGAEAEPDYEHLFDDHDIANLKVHRFDILIDEVVYEQTIANLDELLGTPTCTGGPGGPPGPGGPRNTEDPMWAPVTVKFDGLTWWQVGMRYKGNSSLRYAWQSCRKKLAFRLDFDQFEDEHPELEDQRFYGFKKMTFSSGFKDSSLVRDKLAADMFRRAGVVAARGSFAQIYVTIGEQEPTYFGLYTMIEDPSNRLLDSQFDDDDGNLYKPEGRGGSAASWADGETLAAIEESFPKKTNKDEADWSDVQGAIAALHADTRLSDPAAWRTALEARVNVKSILRWLAANQAMVNWDTYGCIAHNYYLYADPSNASSAAPGGRLTWFPWDLNQALANDGICDYSAEAALIPGSEVMGDDWPVVRFLLDDQNYAEFYQAELARSIAEGGALDAAWVQGRLTAYHERIAPFVVGPVATELHEYTFIRDPATFAAALTELREHLDVRIALVDGD